MDKPKPTRARGRTDAPGDDRPGGTSPSFDVLLVEDNPGDVRLVREAFREVGFDADLYVTSDGVEAMAFLNEEETPSPDVVLLDLNLPRKDGLDVLADIKGDPARKRLPVLMLTSSTAAEDVQRCYEHHANAYLTKPIDPGEFVRMIESVAEFWTRRVRLPSDA